MYIYALCRYTRNSSSDYHITPTCSFVEQLHHCTVQESFPRAHGDLIECDVYYDHPANEVQTRLNNRPDRFLFEIHDLKTHYTKHIL